MTTSHNTWLYSLVPANRLPPPDLVGVADESLRIVTGPEIAAVAGSVPRADFDEEPLRAHLEDPAWLERTARAHHRVVDALARSGPALPMRFATMYRDDQRAAAMLDVRRDELLAALRRITDHTEWGVKVYLVDTPGTAPGSSTSGPAGQEPRPGTAYLLRRKAERDDQHQRLRRALEEAENIHAMLSATATESTKHPVQSIEASGRGEPMLLNGAYLIDDGHRSALGRTLDALAADHPELRVEVTGPWPPYSFSGFSTEPEDG